MRNNNEDATVDCDTVFMDIEYVLEKIVHVPKKVIVEVEKRVPVVEVEWVDREVPIPQIQYEDKIVFKEQVKEVIKHVREKIVIEVPVEKIREVETVEKYEVVKTVITESPEVDIPLPYLVNESIVIPRYVYIHSPSVVAQTVQVSIKESETETVDVVMNEYIPRFIASEVHLPVPVGTAEGRTLITKTLETNHVPVGLQKLSRDQWNAIVKDANAHILKSTNHQDLKNFGLGQEMVNTMLHNTGDMSDYFTGIGSFCVDPAENDWATKEVHPNTVLQYKAMLDKLEQFSRTTVTPRVR